jgi:hypothetical protein
MSPVGKRNQFHQLSSFERGRIIIGLREARSTENGKVSTVLSCCQAWFEKGRKARVPGSDRRRITTAAQDRYLTIMGLRDRHNFTRRVVWC